MTNLKEMDVQRVVDFLKLWAPGRADRLDNLFRRVSPRFRLDREAEEIVFCADPPTHTITLGNRGSCRLQAHAYAAGIWLTAMATPGYLEMASEERKRLCDPADPLLTWAVGRDLQQMLKDVEGHTRDLDEIMVGAGPELPSGLLKSLSKQQRCFGEGFFSTAIAFIILHELAHLDLNHSARCTSDVSIQQEAAADRYAAEWLLECPNVSQARRLNCLFGMTIAMAWLTVLNVYLGPTRSATHPESCDRLYNLLHEFVDEESDDERLTVWGFTARTLFVHVDNAGIAVDAAALQGSEEERVKYLIDLIACRTDSPGDRAEGTA
ncbi:MAG: hypothetical protein JXB62_04015 [Pirellulales bacterium]|nr:hypothetical protein [Pirellulales bacterium]